MPPAIDSSFLAAIRGLHHLVMNSETGTTLKIKVLNVSKKDLQRDLREARDQSRRDLPVPRARVPREERRQQL